MRKNKIEYFELPGHRKLCAGHYAPLMASYALNKENP